MSIVDWAHVVLPLLALGWGACVAARHAEAIDAWVRRLDAWWAEQIDPPRRRP